MQQEVKVLPYCPLPHQQQLHDDTHRFRTIVAGRRVGKTTFAINELLKLALLGKNSLPFWYLAPFAYQAKNIAWPICLKYIPKELWAKKPSETTMTFYLINGSTISLKGSDNPLGLEGVALGGLIVDEVSAISHFESLWENTLRPMLSDYEAPAIFISKPRGYNWFYDLAKKGDHLNIVEGDIPDRVTLNSDFVTYRFTTELNCLEHYGGYIHHEEIQQARKQLTPEAFDQEYLAKFTNYSGLVHKTFDRQIHVIAPFEVPKEWGRIRGFDFGAADPTASVRIAIDPDRNWFVEYCYKERSKTIADHVEYIKNQDSDLEYIVSGFGDPSGRQWITEFNHLGLSIVSAHREENTTEKNWVQLEIDKINEKLQPREGHIVLLPDGRKLENAPSLFILQRPENMPLVYEFESLAYKETQQGINIAQIDDTRDKAGHYDLQAALRYAIISEGHKVSYQTLDTAPSARPEEDARIKEMLKDEEQRKALEHQADLEIIKQQQQNNW